MSGLKEACQQEVIGIGAQAFGSIMQVPGLRV